MDEHPWPANLPNIAEAREWIASALPAEPQVKSRAIPDIAAILHR